MRRRSCGAGVLSIQQPFGRDQLVFARPRHPTPLAYASGKQGEREMTQNDLLLGFLCGIAFASAVMLAYAELVDHLDRDDSALLT